MQYLIVITAWQCEVRMKYDCLVVMTKITNLSRRIEDKLLTTLVQNELELVAGYKLINTLIILNTELMKLCLPKNDEVYLIA